MANPLPEISPEYRQFFDEHVEFVVAQLPKQVTDFMERVPLVVEDYPSADVMRRMRIRHPAHLYGLYTGVPLTQRSVDQSVVMSDVSLHLIAWSQMVHDQGIALRASRGTFPLKGQSRATAIAGIICGQTAPICHFGAGQNEAAGRCGRCTTSPATGFLGRRGHRR